MQIPSSSSDEFIKSMTEKSEKIRQVFLEKITESVKPVSVKVMLGDSTVTDQKTFDPEFVKRFFQNLLSKLTLWKTQGISSTIEKDLRRIFIKFETKEGNYILSCHMSLQFHALLYYKLDNRVIEIQKELSDIIEKIKHLESRIMENGNDIVLAKLKKMGYENLDERQLFEVFFQNELLTNELIDDVYSNTSMNFQDLSKKKSELFKELDNMLIEIYHTTPVLIDEIRMIGAEEGCLCKFDLEYVKNENKEGNFEPTRIPIKIKNQLLNKMDEVFNSTKNS